MIHTTIICGGGFAIFAFSDFAPTSRFAGMMILLLGAALVGDLLVLPALLLGPLGRQFETAFRSLESAGERSLMHGDAADRSLPPDVNNRPARTPANQVISGLKLPRPRTANPAVPDADRPLTR